MELTLDGSDMVYSPTCDMCNNTANYKCEQGIFCWSCVVKLRKLGTVTVITPTDKFKDNKR